MSSRNPSRAFVVGQLDYFKHAFAAILALTPVLLLTQDGALRVAGWLYAALWVVWILPTTVGYAYYASDIVRLYFWMRLCFFAPQNSPLTAKN